MPSHKANKWGTAGEYVMARHWGVRLTDDEGNRIDTDHYDGLRGTTPWEFKVAKNYHADGNRGNFKIYREAHEKLKAKNGRYGLGVYEIRGNSFYLKYKKTVPASKLPLFRWHGGGEHRGMKQTKLPIEAVFG